MKFAITLFVVLASLSVLPLARAQKPLKIVTYDSLTADSLNVNLDLDQHPDDVKGHSNGSNVVLKTPGDWVLAKFFHGSSESVMFQPGSKIEFYWQRAVNDTGKVFFILRYYRDDWFSPDGPGDTVLIAQGGVTAQKYTMTVVGSGYNTVEVKMDGTQGWKPIYMDAIILVQHGTLDSLGNTSGVDAPLAEASSFRCYPNPFIATQGTTLRSVDQEQGTYIVIDMLGREIASVEAKTNPQITVPSGGTYFIRKRVGSEWVGAPLRIVAE